MSDFKAIQCTKFGFHWGSAPDPAGAYSASSDLLAVFRGSASNGMKGKRRGMEGREGASPPQYFGLELPLLLGAK